MASKKATSYKLSSSSVNPSVQIKTFVDPNKSIDQLLQAGKAGNDGRIYDKKPKAKFPSAYYTPLLRPRGSSAGHSPQGSADDGMNMTGRNTLSPSAMTSQQTPMSTPIHQRQFSAPELESRHLDMTYSNRPVGSQPPIMAHHQHSKSVSAIPPLQEQYQPQVQHMRSVSHEASHFCQSYGGHPSFPQEPSVSTMYDPRGKSQSHDALLSMSDMAPPVPNIDRLGPLPPNWEHRLDEHGNSYFVDHNNKTTTWFDPRQPQSLQEEQVRSRHGPSFSHDASHLNYYPPDQSAQSATPYNMNNANNDFNASTFQRVQQLEHERNSMQERQEQLVRAGLIKKSPNQYPNSHSPLQNNMNMPTPHDQYRYNSMPNQHLLAYSCENEHRLAAEAASDSGMEVDFPAPIHSIDPTFAIGDINPHEFEKYLDLSENHTGGQYIPR